MRGFLIQFWPILSLIVIMEQMCGAADCCSIHAVYSLICLYLIWPFLNEDDGILSSMKLEF